MTGLGILMAPGLYSHQVADVGDLSRSFSIHVQDAVSVGGGHILGVNIFWCWAYFGLGIFWRWPYFWFGHIFFRGGAYFFCGGVGIF